MLSAPLLRLLIDLPDIPGLPGQEDRYVRPPGATSAKYFEWLENNSHVVYPALIVVVLVLIGLGILQAWRTHDLDGVQKAELKREIIKELRRDLGGRTADSLAKHVGLPPFRMLKLLEEMQVAGIVDCRTDTARLTTWRIRGFR